jgi:ATP-binding cassette subfamily B protein
MSTMNSQSSQLTLVAPKKREAQKPLNLAIIRRLFGYMRPHARLRNWLFFVAFLRAVQMPVLAAMFGWIIDGPIKNRNYEGVLWWTGGFAALSLSMAIVMHFRMHLAMRLGEAVVYDMRKQIFDQLQRLSMSYFDKTKVGRIISRVTSDVEALRRGVQEVLFVTLIGMGWMLVAAALMAWVDWVLFLAVLCLVPIAIWINFIFRKRLSKAYRDVQESFSRVTSTLAESVMGIRVTQGFVREDVNAELFGDLIEDHSEFHMTAAQTSGQFRGMLEFTKPLFLALLLMLGGYFVLSPEFDTSVGDLIMFFFLADMFFDPITNIGKQYDTALSAMAGAERVFELLDREPAIEEPTDPKPIGRIEGRVEFRDLWFEYVEDTPVLRDINFVAEPGQTIALVGQTGSGKSSTINLIAKFYLPQKGELLIDGRDIREIESHELHRQMGIVLQKNFLFSGTVMENIRLGKPEASDAQVIESARQLNCKDIIQSLPDGFNTEVGERGGNLSQGQQQLVCFCRAMLADPRILILDEATSAVDPMTEARIQEALHVLLRDRTSFVVAHRLSTIRDAHTVLVVDDGQIIERGTHHELLEHGGVYAGLYRSFIRANES